MQPRETPYEKRITLGPHKVWPQTYVRPLSAPADRAAPGCVQRASLGVARGHQFVIRQPVMMFYSAAYFAAASLTMGAIIESWALIQSDANAARFQSRAS